MVVLDAFSLNEMAFGSQRRNENRNLSQFDILINKFYANVIARAIARSNL